MNIKILRLRYSLKLSQSDMALALGISRSTLVRIERGDISTKADIIKNYPFYQERTSVIFITRKIDI